MTECHILGGQNILLPAYFQGVKTPQPTGSTPLVTEQTLFVIGIINSDHVNLNGRIFFSRRFSGVSYIVVVVDRSVVQLPLC